MKLSIQTVVIMFFAALVSSVAGEGKIYLAIVTMLKVEEPLPAQEVTAIEEAIDAIKPEIDQVVIDAATEQPLNRNLRGTTERELSCVHCPHVVPSYPICFVGGVARSRCTRMLQEHEELPQEAVDELHEADRRRYLQVATMCEEAKSGIANLLSDSSIPVPADGTFIEKCYFEYDDGDF